MPKKKITKRKGNFCSALTGKDIRRKLGSSAYKKWKEKCK